VTSERARGTIEDAEGSGCGVGEEEEERRRWRAHDQRSSGLRARCAAAGMREGEGASEGA
jgi:hypothetical protein